MPRVHHVKAARKDNPVAKKGESYYWWKFRYGGMHYSKTYPKPSQLTQSEFLSQLYDLQEQRDNAVAAFRDDHDFESFKSNIEDVASQIGDLGDECRDKHDNMPEGLQEGDVGQLLESRADKCEEIKDELESALNFDGEDEDDTDPDDPETQITIVCPRCKVETELLPANYRGTYTCTGCNKDFEVTDALVELKREELRTELEGRVEDAAGNVEGVDMDCE